MNNGFLNKHTVCMKKKILLVCALLAISTACFAGCTDKQGSKMITTPDNGTRIVTIDDEQKPAEETPDMPENGEKECPDGKCRPGERRFREGIPHPGHRGKRPCPTKNQEN